MIYFDNYQINVLLPVGLSSALAFRGVAWALLSLIIFSSSCNDVFPIFKEEIRNQFRAGYFGAEFSELLQPKVFF
jgi:hypothetical protein